ncbi:alpha/beta hydrolase [candidate division KSB1 bacterium]|nr:alpha/beta hydrolase [candidate division KSB1 bacterium]MBL7094909.1 alpha/beta hydrolase [candidate division KSB1 bacterium]
MIKFIFTIISSSILIIHSVNIPSQGKNTPPKITAPIDIKQIQKDLNQIDLSAPPILTPSFKKYFQHYDIDFNNAHHYFGTFNAGNKSLAAHIFLRENSQGTIFLLHGYNDHTGMLKNLIRFCLKQNFSIAVYDLPGLGLSSGERGAINNFGEYADIHKTFISLYKNYLPRPFHLIGHSTGCAITYEYLNNNQNSDFEKIIFLAPLVRHAYWGISKIGYFLVRPFTKTVPRVFRKNSSDQSYLEFVKNDPLQNRRIPLKFPTALIKWDKRIKQYDQLERTIYIIQGTKDSVVDWKYNIKFLKKKIETVHLKLIENAKHQLVNENATIRAEVFEGIESFLEQ